jgi:rhodanese-related sulfurtransferase
MSSLKVATWAAVQSLIRARFPQVQPLSTATLADWLAQEGEHPLLLDARKPEEYELSHLPQAHLVPANLEDLRHWETVTNSTPIVTYCSVGYRSAALAEQLQAMGFDRVFNLEGSIFQWANAGHPVYRGEEIVEQVHPYNAFWGVLLDSRFHPDS